MNVVQLSANPHLAFPWLGAILVLLWLVALLGYLPVVTRRLPKLGPVCFVLGWTLLVGYLAWLWIALERPPMRTSGETKLLYTLSLATLGLALQWRWRTRLLVIPVLMMASVFLIITLVKPESLDKTLMPALNSPWFVPHVVAYMFAYALLGMAALVGGNGLLTHQATITAEMAVLARRLINLAFPLLTLGMVIGAVWAKIAWGHYWSWDPKETWAFLTWVVYVLYLHIDRYFTLPARTQAGLVTGSFAFVLICWFGVNILPTAQQSVHTYMK